VLPWKFVLCPLETSRSRGKERGPKFEAILILGARGSLGFSLAVEVGRVSGSGVRIDISSVERGFPWKVEETNMHASCGNFRGGRAVVQVGSRWQRLVGSRSIEWTSVIIDDGLLQVRRG